MAGAAPAAFADDIGAASKKLADASYPLIQAIDWGKSPVLTKWLSESGANWGPTKIAAAVESTLKLGLAMDQDLVVKAVQAHDKAIMDAMNNPKLVTPLADHEEVTEAIARMIASAPPALVKDVFNRYLGVGLKDLNQDWFKTLNEEDARKAYQAFLELKDVVYASGPKGASAVATASPDYSDKLGGAAKVLADASYPLVQNIKWERTPVLTKWLENSAATWSPQKIAAAVDSTLKLSVAMDQGLVKKSVAAHDVAILHSMGKPGLQAPLADHEAVTESIVRMLASAPPEKVKAVFDTYSQVGLQGLNKEWFAKMTPADAQAAYKTFLALSEVVKVS